MVTSTAIKHKYLSTHKADSYRFFCIPHSHNVGTHQLLAIVVALNDTVVRDAHWHHQHICNRPGGQCVYHEGQHACTCRGRLPAAGAGTFQVDLQKLLLTQQLLGVLRGDESNTKAGDVEVRILRS